MAQSYKHIVILTGAGISAESGIKTFRACDGLWEEHKVEDVATPEGYARDPELVLRFYDQSHLIREFVALFGMSPSQFVATPQPILTLALESRQARRLELIERITPGEARPWQ